MSSSDFLNNLDQPVQPPPPGQVSNFENPPSRANAVYIAAGICLPLIVFFALARFYAKLKVIKKKSWDDLTCALGVAAGIIFISLTVVEVAGGAIGSHSWDTKLRKMTKKELILSLLVKAIYGPCIWLIRLSLFVLYLEIFGRIRWLRYSVFAGIFATGIFYLVSLTLLVTKCGPRGGHSRSSYWNGSISPQCIKNQPVGLAKGIMNVISDVYLVVLPLPVVWSLQMPMRRKMGVAAMILTGLVACIASVMGAVYRAAYIRNKDSTWEVIPVAVTTIIEMTAGLLVCCMPAMASILRPRLSQSKSAASGSGQRPLLPDSARTGSPCELQPMTPSSMHQVWVSTRQQQQQHATSPDHKLQGGRVQEDEIDGAGVAFPKSHIQKVTRIEVF